ncbi:unnamed protein product, partial [Mesorhabditis spiculigera]
MILQKTSALTCLSCFGDSMNSSCYAGPDLVAHGMQTCDGECQVWKVQSEVTGDVYMFERTCSQVCKDGCTHIADMEHRFISCGTCCAEDLCNKGNLTSSNRWSWPRLLIVLFLVLIKS